MKHPQSGGFDRYAPLLIIFWGLLSYANSLEGDFQLDDHHIILNNDHITSFSNFSRLDLWSRLFFNRQLAMLTFAVNYRLHGYDVFGYHVVNLAVHLLAALCSYWLIRLIYASRAICSSPAAKGASFAALAGGLIFVCHPIQTQAVSYITQRMASMAGLFYLAALCLYAKGRYAQVEGHSLRGPLWYYLGTAGCYLLGVFSKATIYSLPAALLLFEICFVRDHKGQPFHRYILIYSAAICGFALTLLLVRGESRMRGAPPIWTYLLTEFKALVIYLKLLVLPAQQMVIYDLALSPALGDGPTLLALLLLLAIGLGGILVFFKARLLAFAIGWFFVTLAVESSLVPLKYPIFEYRLYLPIFGFALLVPALLLLGLGKQSRIWPPLVLILLLVPFTLMTWRQNQLWRSPLALWRHNLAMAPHSAEVHHHLGYTYFIREQYQPAAALLDRAVALDPDYFAGYNQRGLVRQMLGDYTGALADFDRAIDLNPKLPHGFYNRGGLSRILGQYEKAQKDFAKVVALQPRSASAYANLGYLHLNLGHLQKAQQATLKALELDPNQAWVHIQQGDIAAALGQHETAVSAYQTALSLAANLKEAYNNLGIAYFRLGQLDKADGAFTAAIGLDPSFADAYYNRAMVFCHLGDKIRMAADIQSCLHLEPDHSAAGKLKAQLHLDRANNKL